jgi:aminoglycoside/choline kinase family phosphotransferase
MSAATGTADAFDREGLDRWLAQRLPGRGPFAVTLMAGGASPRRFCRVRLGDGETLVAMLVPEQTPDVAKARELGRRWPFLEVRELLYERGVRVPALLAEDCAGGRLLVEDLGDTLALHLRGTPSERVPLYHLAVRDLAAAQRALDPLPHDSIVRLRAFDHALLSWEVRHFREWGLEARGIALSESQAQRFERAVGHLATTIAALSRGFVHRDYQSRNLMVCQGGDAPELGWIDFQDALMGPRAYDLVALLCDSYQPFDRAFVDDCLNRYAESARLSDKERRSLAREFDLITVQRKLKDAGRFVFIERTKGDPSFLPFVDPTLGIVRQALDRLTDDEVLRDLRELLHQVIPGGGGAPS